jgi:excisionase family DNA binding protein
MEQEHSPMLTTEEVAELLKLHPLTVRRLAREGEIPAFKVGRQWRVKKVLLDHWIRERSLGDKSEKNVPTEGIP